MIYLDHNATTAIRPEAVTALLPFLTETPGNPASVHAAGRAARRGLDEARRQVAALFTVHDSQIVFTSGGTESNHAALLGLAARADFRGRLLTSAVEHPSLLHACAVLEQRGMVVTRLPVDGSGRLAVTALRDALDGETVGVSVMHANNETGVLQPVAEIGALCRRAGVPFHVDAVQSAGKLPVGLELFAADLLSVSAHKFGGPKGVGALVVDKRFALEPLLGGGGQERGRRSGTENLSGIVGFGAAAEVARREMAREAARLAGLRDEMEGLLRDKLPELVVFSVDAERLPNTSALGLPGLDGETLVMSLDLAGFAVSSGSACSSGRSEPSHVLQAMGVDPALARSLVRVSLGWNTGPEEVSRFVRACTATVNRLKSMAGPLAMAV